MKRTPIPPEMRQAVLERDNYTCRYCGNQEGPFWMDHVYPFSKGGETTKNNLVTACVKCNTSKGSRVGRWPNANVGIAKVIIFPFFGMLLATIGLLIAVFYPAWMYFVPTIEKSVFINIGIGIISIGVLVSFLELHNEK